MFNIDIVFIGSSVIIESAYSWIIHALNHFCNNYPFEEQVGYKSQICQKLKAQLIFFKSLNVILINSKECLSTRTFIKPQIKVCFP